MRYLTAEDILILHALVMDETGGSHGVRDTALLASVAHTPQSRFGGKELYPGIFLKAAVLLEAIANYHVFVNGNKRTSLIAASRFLFLNGYEFRAGTTDAENTIRAVATKQMSISALAAWLRKNNREKD